MDSNMLNSNRLGFRGTEDLGGGMSASFWLEGGMANDAGNGGGTNGAFNFQRRSTVSLSGSFGEIRLGRDYTNAFSTKATYDAYGANGMGTALNLYAGTVAGLGSGATTRVRADNMIGYFLPGNLGGLYGSVQYSAGETGNGATVGNKYTGFRVGYSAGPFDISGSLSSTQTATSDDFKTTNLGASYNMGFAKVMALYDVHKYGALKYTTTGISTSVPMGAGEFRAAYTRGNANGGTIGGNDANLFGLEYIHNLSKRTALYTQYARLKNSGASKATVGTGPAITVNDASSTGYGVGVRHSF